MTTNSTSCSLGTILVTGGCGFLGFHLVGHLLQEPEHGPIYVLSRAPTKNLQDNVTYRAGDVTNAQKLAALLEEIKPKVIFHTASPAFMGSVSAQQFYDTNIKGTEIMLKCAREAPSVQALVYTSSITVFSGAQYFNINEDHPVWSSGEIDIPYYVSKAIADKLVLNSNTSQLRTISLRLAVMYGERDNQFIPRALEAFHDKQTTVQIGNNQNLFDTVHVNNAASAHVLAAKALLRPDIDSMTERVDGEAFNISDGAPVLYWDLIRTIWYAAGDNTQARNVKVIPAWLALVIADILEWMYWIFTFGHRRPLIFNRDSIEYCVNTRTYNIDKAREKLGYRPLVNLKDGIKKAVDWELQNRPKAIKQKEK